MNRTKSVIALLLILPLASGCTALFGMGSETRHGVSSSLVDYLYPDGEVPPAVPDRIPQLELPLRVGIAFVPGRQTYGDLPEAAKMGLLEQVRGHFLTRDYIAHIEVIPDTYLRSSRGIGGMQQVARLYGVDVMALVSYDQVTVAEDNVASLMYWTIVGAYVIPGTSQEVQTFIDTAVFDVPTAKLLFRAPGVHSDEGLTTAVGSDAAARKRRQQSFEMAVEKMTANLDFELVRFEERLQNEPMLAEVSWQQGYGGMGAFDGWLLLILVLVAIAGIAVTAEESSRPS